MDLKKKYDNTGKRKTALPSLARDIASDWGSGSYNIGNINGVRSTTKTTPSIAGAVAGAASRNYSSTDPTASVIGAISGAIPRTPSGLSPDAVLAGAIRGSANLPSLPSDTVKGTTSSGGGASGSSQQITIPTSVGDLPTYNSEYMDKLNELARQLTSMNYDDWTKGSQYQALAGRYGNNGRMSMQDVLGQIASRTGGLASSYATTAAQQQYNQYMAQLEEVARQMYSQDRSDLMDNANLYRNLANDEYDRYRDSVADYNERLAAAQKAALEAARLAARGSGGGGGGGANSTSSSSRKRNNSGNESTGLDNYDAVKNNILMYASRGMGSVGNRIIKQVWNDLNASQQDDLISTLRKKEYSI